MGLNDFILNCEKYNKQLEKDIEYYKNKSKGLEKKLQQSEEVIEEAIKFINNARYDKELKTIAYGGLNVSGINNVLDILNKYKKEIVNNDH